MPAQSCAWASCSGNGNALASRTPQHSHEMFSTTGNLNFFRCVAIGAPVMVVVKLARRRAIERAAKEALGCPGLLLALVLAGLLFDGPGSELFERDPFPR